MGVELRDGSARFTIARGSVKSDETLVIASSVGQGVSSVATTIADGPVPPCELVDAGTSGGAATIEAIPIPPGGEGAGGAVPASPAEPSLQEAPEAGSGAAGPSMQVGPEAGTDRAGPNTEVAPQAGTDGAAAGGTSSGGK